MTKPQFQRARSPEHKAQRSSMILSAAATVLDREGIEATTLGAIAAEAGIAKSNTYRYFESREEILVQLLATDTTDLIDHLCTSYAEIAGQDDLERMADHFADACADRPRFCLLISQLAPILERNISVDRVIEIKRGFLTMMVRMGEHVALAAPSIPAEHAAQLPLLLSTHVAGLWPGKSPAPALAAAMEVPDLQVFQKDFRDTLYFATLTFMRGLQQRA